MLHMIRNLERLGLIRLPIDHLARQILSGIGGPTAIRASMERPIS